MDPSSCASGPGALIVLSVLLAVAISGCGDTYPPQQELQKQQTASAQISVPADLSVYRGNLQRTGIFANGGMPPLEHELWRQPQRNSIDPDFAPIMAGDLFIVAVLGEGIYGLDAKTGETRW